MTLFHRDLGGAGKPPLVIIHGMLGSSRNWVKAGSALGDLFHVLAVDLPNHGQSPSLASASVSAMADLVLEWMDDQGIRTAGVMGHSLGGKVAMRLAIDHAERVERLYVLDVAPKTYYANYTAVDAMLEIDPAPLTTRAEAEDLLSRSIRSQANRWFLLTNLTRGPDGRLRWQVPLEIIRDHIAAWTQTVLEDDDVYHGPTTFIAGGQSDYVSQGDFDRAQQHFPDSDLIVLPESGHNVHIDGGEAFQSAVRLTMEHA